MKEVDMPELEIVGESHYQDAFEQLTGGKTEDGFDLLVEADFVPEANNPYDANAVRVCVGEHHLGYLSRESAQTYRVRIGNARSSAAARITGGWDRGDGDTGSFGIRIEP